MLPVHTILHPTDFSEQSDNAFRLACALARDHGARLILLHVVMTPTVVYGEGFVPLDLEDHFREANVKLAHLEPGASIHAERRVEEGNAVEEIQRVVEAEHCDLIV